MERRSCRTEAELVGTPEGLLAAFQWHAAPADEAGALADESCGHLDKLTVTALTYQRARRCPFQDHKEKGLSIRFDEHVAANIAQRLLNPSFRVIGGGLIEIR